MYKFVYGDFGSVGVAVTVYKNDREHPVAVLEQDEIQKVLDVGFIREAAKHNCPKGLRRLVEIILFRHITEKHIGAFYEGKRGTSCKDDEEE